MRMFVRLMVVAWLLGAAVDVRALEPPPANPAAGATVQAGDAQAEQADQKLHKKARRGRHARRSKQQEVPAEEVK